MKFVIELDDFTCGAAKRQVVRRGWERKRRVGSQLGSPRHRHQNPSWAGGGKAAPKPNRNKKTLSRVRAHRVKCKGECETTTGRRNTTKISERCKRTLTFDVQGIGGWVVILRNAHCPRTVLSVYTQHLSTGRSVLPLLRGGHERGGGGKGVALAVGG